MRPDFPGRSNRRFLIPALCVFVGVLATAFAISGKPVLVVLLVDTSQSITTQTLVEVRTLAVDLLHSLPPGSAIKAYSFDDRSLLVAQTSDPAVLATALSGLSARGNHTVLYDAIFDRARELQEQPRTAAEVLLVVTDGKDKGSASQAEDAARAAQAANVSVFAVGIGSVNSRQLRRIAKLTDGAYFPIGNCNGESLALSIQGKARPIARPTPRPPRPEDPAASEPAPPQPPSLRVLGPLARWVLAGCLVVASALAATLLLRRRTAVSPLKPPQNTEMPTPTYRSQPYSTLDPSTFTATVVRPADEFSVVVQPTQLIQLGDGTLAIQEGTGVGQVFKVSHRSDTVLGRSQLADVHLPDLTVSLEHCRISARRGFYLLQDLNSRNGTFVNGERITEHVLRNRDVLRIGETALEFRAAP